MKIYLATPCYGPLEPEAAHSFALAMASLVADGHEVQWSLETRDANQSRARNALLWRFLRSGFDRIVWLDKDCVFTPDDVRKLALVEEDVVSGLCKKKEIGSDYVGDPVEGEPRRGPLLEMRFVGFGVFSMSRRAAERATFMRVHNQFVHPHIGERMTEVFWTEVRDDAWWSSDAVFCRWWRERGGQIWAHTEVKIGHVGSMVFR